MTRNVQYWLDYWASLFSGIEHRRFSLSLISPRVLLRELAEEIETRGLKNADNRQFFFSQINKYFAADIPTQRCLHLVLTLIRREFDKPRLEVLSQLCRRGLGVMDSLQYFDHAVDALRELLTGQGDVKRDQLYLLCQDLIVELLEAGYSQKYVEKIPRILFSDITEGGRSFWTEFPHDLPYTGASDDPKARDEYDKKVQAFLERLTEADRIDALKKYPRLPRQNCRFIFQVRGIKGKMSFDIGPVHFYAPTEEKYLKNLNGLSVADNPELFHSTEHVYLNAAVAVSTADIDSGVAIANRKIIEAINCLHFVLGRRANYEVGQDYIAVDENGKLSGMSSSLDRRSELLNWHESLNVTPEIAGIVNESDLLQEAAPQILSRGFPGTVERRLMDALHWYRKGKDAEAPEDQILWFWISIECILGPAMSGSSVNGLLCADGKENVVSVAFELLPRLRCLATAYDRGWTLFHELNSMLAVPEPFRRLIIPDSLKERAGLNQKGKRVYLRAFVESIPDLLTCLPDTVLREHLAEANIFYTDPKKANSSIEDERKAFRSDVVMLYRIRNKIVHSAAVGDTTLPYYVRSASEFARELIRRTIGQFYKHGNRTLAGIVATLFSEYDLLLQRIETEGTASALFDE